MVSVVLMGFLRGLRSVVSFLTIIPVKSDPEAARHAGEFMYIFPLVGIFIGFCSGVLALGLLQVLPRIVVGIATLGFIFLLTGLHHTDGLLDFGDGIMFQGPPDKRIDIMHDTNTGTGGLVLGVTIIIATVFSISELNSLIIIQSLIVAEVSAKLSMVIMAWGGKSARPGLNTYFVNPMHGRYRKLRLTTALGISISITFYLLRLVGLVALLAGIVTALIMLLVSSRRFRGVTGDVFGATNDITRMISLIVILGATGWL